jgi:hypothetical protein
VAQIGDQLARGEPYQVYDPRIFIALKHWLQALDIASDEGDAARFHQALHAVPPPLGPILRRAVERTGSLAPVVRAMDEVRGAVLRKRIADWQDAFRTMKMVHALRDEGLGTVAAEHVLQPYMQTP